MKTKWFLQRYVYGALYYLNCKLHLLFGFNSSSLKSPITETILNGTVNPIVVDIGCNKGDFVYEIVKLRSNSTFYCFDINPECGIALKSRFPQSNINFYNLGLSDASGEFNFVSRFPYDRKAFLSFKEDKHSQDMGLNKVKIATLA